MKIIRAVLILAVASTAVAAQGRGRGGGGGGGGPPSKVRVTYTSTDRESDGKVIAAYFRDHPSDKPGRGRGRGRGAPPGWNKKVVRSVVVPVEYREYFVPAPLLLVQTLPPVQPSWQFVMIENEVVLVDRSSWLVIDIVFTF